ncbi:TIM barrel protein [Xinfangfangia sp. CPCC 101601]|uniref:TIM barrel protein n=1 Tax=Pseudogemmobacter lacusdianii TaxID=3069608 RepID=A0ABU0VVD7_9RHOB|nr:TIM barrel protein [Xinfangfangia sp. CPCC 101601]MDQ2065643.1 TIM barrel protein [Xinfangfangia sp. CPCC 101601]
MPDLPLLGAAAYLDELASVPGLRAWIEGRDLEIRDFTALGALQGEAWRDIAGRVKAEFSTHAGRIGLHGPFLGFAIDQPDPDLRAVVQDRILTALAALEEIAPNGQGHMVLHSPFTTWSGFNTGTEMDDQEGMIARSLALLTPAVRRAEAIGATIVIENCEDRCPHERVTLVRAFNSPALKVSLDTGHAHYAHGSTAAPPVDAYVRAAGDLLAHVHLQDADGIADRHWALGRGNIHWHGVFMALRARKTMPRLILEMAQAEDILVSAHYLMAEGLAR